MNLTNELISQFAKATKDNTKTKTESTVYGTVKIVDGKIHVQIDGSESVTPVSTTANALDGERVMVQIKNHTAIIIGNITSPSARTEDLKNVSIDVDTLLKAINGKLDPEMANKLYANIDLTNIAIEAIKTLLTNSGMFTDLIIKEIDEDEKTITGELIGVIINGDLIIDGSIKPSKISLEDGTSFANYISSVNTTIEDLQKQLEDLTTDLEASQKQIENLTTDIEESQKQIEDLQTQIDEMNNNP